VVPPGHRLLHPAAERIRQVQSPDLILQDPVEEGGHLRSVQAAGETVDQVPENQQDPLPPPGFPQVLRQPHHLGGQPPILNHVGDPVDDPGPILDDDVRVAADQGERHLPEQRGDGEPVGEPADGPRLEGGGGDPPRDAANHPVVKCRLDSDEPGCRDRKR